jgi:hypothetical protein
MKTFAFVCLVSSLMAFTGCASDQPATTTTTTSEESTVVSHPVQTTTTQTTVQPN